MTDLATVLARMTRITYIASDGLPSTYFNTPEEMLDTPEGQALAALVEAALAWRVKQDPRDGWSSFDQPLIDAIDAYREATR